MHYIIGDVHGCYDEFIALRNKIEKQDPMFDITLVGDIIDRGDQSWFMIQWALKNIPNSMKYHCVLGNHEDMIIQWYQNEIRRGSKYLEDCIPARYGFNCYIDDKSGAKTSMKSIGEIVRLFQSFPLYRVIKIKDNNKCIHKYVISHADVPLKLDGTIDDSASKDRFIWSREHLYQFDVDNLSDYILIHGHTPTYENCMYSEAQQGKIGYKPNCINVDTGCVFNGKHLGAICLETMEEMYI